MPVCFECGEETPSRYCEKDGMATFLPDAAPTRFALPEGQILDGRYRVQQRLSRGGMGEVYQALNVRTGGAVAVKTLFLQAHARRFYHEAWVTAALMPHPNVVEIFDFGQTEQGVFFLVMELLCGESLAQRLDQRGKLTEEEACLVALQVLEGLSRAHEHRLVHRDLTPGNIFLHRLRAGWEVAKLLDFGIAKGPSMALTLEDQILGTPAYMAPERCLGHKPEDPRGDLYALGVVLFECVSGELPLSADSAAELLVRQVRDPVPSLLSRAPVSPAFAAVVDRALRKEPADRFPDARAMRTALEDCLLTRTPDGPMPLVLARAAAAEVLLGRSSSGALVHQADHQAGHQADQRAAHSLPGPEVGRVSTSIRASRGGAVRRWLPYPLAALLILSLAALAMPAGRIGAAWSSYRLHLGDALRHKDRTEGAQATEGGSAMAAARRYQAGCEHGEAAACRKLAALYREGGSRDPALAAYFDGKACDAGDPYGCAQRGRVLIHGEGVAQDDRAGGVLLKRGCEGGISWACAHLGDLYQFGRGVAKDEVRAAALYQRACDNGTTGACASLAMLFDSGRGVNRDPARAAGLYDRACAAGYAASCVSLAGLLVQGQAVPRDLSRAATLYQRGCEAGSGVACFNLGTLYEGGKGVTQDPALAAQRYRQGCDRGDAGGCSHLGDLYVHGKGVQRDPAQGFSLLRKGCQKGSKWGCNYLRDARQSSD